MSDAVQPVALVTGAGSGIGRAIALALAAEGFRLGLVGRTEAKLRQTAEQVATSGKIKGRDTIVIVGDVAEAETAPRAVGAVVGAFGRLDVLINNAGYAPVAPVTQMSDAQWHQTLDVNLSSVFYFCRAAWPELTKAAASRAEAVIVNISSQAARDPFAGLGAYAAAKAGVNLLGLALSREGKEAGIRVHTVAPGATETPMFRQLATPEQFPTEHTMAPADVAAVVMACVRGELRHASGEVIYLRKTV